MPTLTTDPPRVQCRVQIDADHRCMRRPYEHNRRAGDADHEYESLTIPCIRCDAEISWSAGDWRDSLGNVGHVPDPSFL